MFKGDLYILLWWCKDSSNTVYCCSQQTTWMMPVAHTATHFKNPKGLSSSFKCSTINQQLS